MLAASLVPGVLAGRAASANGALMAEGGGPLLFVSNERSASRASGVTPALAGTADDDGRALTMTRALIDAAVLSGQAVRSCSGSAWSLSGAGELHVYLPRPRAHVVLAGDDDVREHHALLIAGMREDDAREYLTDRFEAIYLDAETGKVAHRNATPPVRFFSLRTDDGDWEGRFVLSDASGIDHMHAWLRLAHPAARLLADGLSNLELVLEPVPAREAIPGFCPSDEVEHVIYIAAALGADHFEHIDVGSGESDDVVLPIGAAEGVPTRRVMLSSPRDEQVARDSQPPSAGRNVSDANIWAAGNSTNGTTSVVLDESPLEFANDTLSVPQVFATPVDAKVLELIPLPPIEMLKLGCYESTVNWEADASMEKLFGKGTVGALLAATAGMNNMYADSGIVHKAGQVIVGNTYKGTLGSGMIQDFRDNRRVSGGDLALLATNNRGKSGPAGLGYVGTLCGKKF